MLNTTFTNATDRMLVRNKHFEVQYAEMLENLMINGTYSEDRTGVGTQRIQSDVIHIPANQIPLMVGKKIMPENAFTEIIWMLKGDTNTKFLKEHGVNYWDSWADENGDLGAVYGKQFRDFNGEDQYRDNINELILNPDSRRIISELWNVSDLQAMSLTPCHKTYHLTSFINHAGKRVVDLHMSQRSADIFLGVPYNFMLAYYYLHIACYMTDSIPNEIHITFNDLHLYDTHREQAQKYLDRIKEDKDNLLSLVIENNFVKENSYTSITADFEPFTSKEIDDNLNYLFDNYDKIFKPTNYKHYSFLKAQIAV